MFQINPYFSLGKGEETEEAVNYIDYSTLTVNNGVIEIDNKEGTNILFLPSRVCEDYVLNDEEMTIYIRFKNLIPCKLIVNIEAQLRINIDSHYWIIRFNNFVKCNINRDINTDDWSVCTTSDDPEENYINFCDFLNAFGQTLIYEMTECKNKIDGKLVSVYILDFNYYICNEV